MISFRLLALTLALSAAACGASSTPAPETPIAPATSPTPATPGALLGMSEISVSESGKQVIAVHASGDVEIADDKGTLKPFCKLTTDGKLILGDGESGQLQQDGSFTTPQGAAPFKLDGAQLIAGSSTVTIEGGKLLVGGQPKSELAITGADSDGAKRTALLLFAILELAQQMQEAGGSATAPAPAAPAKK